MNCDKCEKSLTGTFRFCPYCGTAIENDTPEALLKYITKQKERIESTGKDAARWIKWEQWVKEKLLADSIVDQMEHGKELPL